MLTGLGGLTAAICGFCLKSAAWAAGKKKTAIKKKEKRNNLNLLVTACTSVSPCSTYPDDL
jgi:hypothetical protein